MKNFSAEELSNIVRAIRRDPAALAAFEDAVHTPEGYGLEDTVPSYDDATKVSLINAAKQSVTYSSGATETIPIAQDGTLAGIDLSFVGTLTTHGTPGSPTARTYNPLELAKLIEIRANGSKTLQKMSGLEAYFAALWAREGNPVAYSGVTTTQVQTSGTGFAISFQIPIDFTSLGQAPASFGLIQANKLISLDLVLTQGAVTDIQDGGSNAPTLTGTWYIRNRYVRHANSPNRGFGLFRKEFTSVNYSAASTDVIVKLHKGTALHQIIVTTYAGSTSLPSASVLTGSAWLTVGGEKVWEGTAQQVIDSNAQWWNSSKAPTAGVYVLDFTRQDRQVNRRSMRGMLKTATDGPEVNLHLGLAIPSGFSARVVVIESIGVTEAAQMMGLPVVG